MPNLESLLLGEFGEGFNKNAEEVFNSTFLNNRQTWVNQVIEGYTKYNTDPNVSISKIAQTYSLNDEQTKRIVEDANVGIYLQKYAQTKGNSVRRVIFPIADLDKIKQSVVSVVKTASSPTVSEETTFNKVASTIGQPMNFDLGDNYIPNAYNSSPSYEPSLWEVGAPEKTACEIMKRKLTTKLQQTRQEKTALIRGILQKIAFVGDALIYHERAGQSAQDLLDKLAHEENFVNRDQLPIIKYTMSKIASLKEDRKLPGNFNMSLNISSEKNEPFSLGRHSLNKKANNDIVVKVQHLPEGTDYEKLVQVVRKLQGELHGGENGESKEGRK